MDKLLSVHAYSEQNVLYDSIKLNHPQVTGQLEEITRMACEVLNTRMAVINLTHAEQQFFVYAKETILNLSECDPEEWQHLIGHHDTVVYNDLHLQPTDDYEFLKRHSQVRFYAGIPLYYGNTRLGTLSLLDTHPRHLDNAQITMLECMGNWIESQIQVHVMQIANEKLKRQLEYSNQEMLLDPLTRTWNRRGMDTILPLEIERAERDQSCMSFMLVDVDFFKTINDTHGHAFGDYCLREIVHRMRANLRPHDVIVRYGGDEFFIILNNCPAEEAREIAERLISGIANKPFTQRSICYPVSISTGVVSFAAMEAIDIHSVIEAVDRCLYNAKAAGRSRMDARMLS